MTNELPSAVMSIDPTSPVPIYMQLKAQFREAILERRFQPDQRLPTEQELCQLYSVSRNPVTRALSELAAEGVIVRYRRRGSFVNPHWLRRADDRGEIRVVVPDYGPWEALIRDAAGNTAVNVVRIPRHSLHRMLTNAVAEGQAPDLAVFDHVWGPEFAEAGFLHPLEELDPAWIDSEHDSDFLHSLAAADRYRGSTYGVPAFAEVGGIWYRRRALEAHAVAPPATWNELLRLARACSSAAGGPRMALAGGTAGGETTTFGLTGLLASNGARAFNSEHVTLNDRAAADTLRFMRKLVTEGCVPAAAAAYEWDKPVHLLAAGQVDIAIGGSYEAETIANLLRIGQREVRENFVLAPMPAGPNGAPASVAAAMILAIFRQAQQPKETMRLLERIVEPERLAASARDNGRLPSRRSAQALVTRELSYLHQTSEMAERAVTRPWIPLYSRVSTQLQLMLEGVLTGRLQPAAAVRHTADLISAITGFPVAKPSTTPTTQAGPARTASPRKKE